MNNNFKKAFSLIEISIVILVIGILIAGISKGIDMVYDMRLATARALTDKAPMFGMENLEMWLETTSENSLATGTTSFTNVKNPLNNDRIGRWNDINPTLINSNNKNHAVQGDINFQPFYIQDGINGLPALLFDGSNDFLSYNGNFLINSDYTIFIVEARTRGSGDNFFLAGSQGVESKNLLLGYWKDQDITHSHWGGNRIDITSIDAYSYQIPRVHSFSFGKNFGKASYVNGGQKISNTSQKTPLSSYPNSSIGKAYTSNFYKGYIAEIIMYSKDLNDADRKLIEAYLIEKWRIKS
jgi:prepilin-type N-terminal cleavage/methylation domain-containing protein